LIKDYDLSGLKTVYLAGERADPDTIEWMQRHLGKPIIDHWWQTETGYTIAGNPQVQFGTSPPGSIWRARMGWL